MSQSPQKFGHLSLFLSSPSPSSLFLSSFALPTTMPTMGVSWQTPDQKAFIENQLPSYSKHSVSGTLKTIFWPEFFGKWFNMWPLPAPAPELVDEGDKQRALKESRGKKVNVSTLCMLTH